MTTDAIYMDNHATTPVDPRVLEAMLPYFTRASSATPRAATTPSAGRPRRRSTTPASRSPGSSAPRPRRSSSPAAPPSPTTWRIKGVVEFYKDKGNHIITATTEHKASSTPARRSSARASRRSRTCRSTSYGLVDPDDVRKAITDKTVLVSIMHANNEIGTIQPLAEIGKIAQREGRPLPHRRDAGRRASSRSTSRRWASTCSR